MSCREIPLTQGKVAIVDAEDFDFVSRFKWHTLRSKNGRYYAARKVRIEGTDYTILMHRFLLNAPSGKDIDHVNRNGLDNQRHNLRLCTRSENNRNSLKRNTGKSRFKGVSWHGAGNLWKVRIYIDHKQISLGYSRCEEEAARAYDFAALNLFGEFARLNFPKEVRANA